MKLETTETSKNSPISDTPALLIDTSQQITTQKSTNPLQRFSRAVGQILTPKTLFQHTSKKPTISYQKFAKNSTSRSTTKRSVNRRTSL
jgi:hypothetical protein